MTKKIIINADDFGISEGAVLGIIKAHRDGILTSTTCMVNMPYAKLGLQLASEYPDLGVGIHLVLTVGQPLIDGAKSYVDKDGNFLRPSAYPNEKPNADPDELYREWKAQIEKFIELAGKKPTHIDSHHHVHLLPQHRDVLIKLAKEYDLPIRQREQITNDYQYVRCNNQFYKDNVNYEYLTSMINDFDEYGEIMCHPALLDWRLYQMSSYNIPRMKELDVLCDEKIKQFIKDNDIELINFSHLKK